MYKPITETPELVLPDYNIERYTAGRYKIIRFNSNAPRALRLPCSDEDKPRNTEKLSQAISRARRVCLELALCNDWKWFGTLTIAKDNFDRSNLDGFYSRFREWLKYQRKISGKKIPYLLVPEQHGDGSWHMHGFFNSDIDEFLVSFKEMDENGYLSDQGRPLPRKLINKNYFNWGKYQDCFGFCSFGEIRNRDAAAFYTVKYISKSFQGGCDRVGLRLYYPSEGLNRAERYDSVYGPCSALDQCLVNHYEWCSTGFFVFQREPGFDPIADILEEQNLRMIPLDLDDPIEFIDVDDYYNFTQECLEGFYA